MHISARVSQAISSGGSDFTTNGSNTSPHVRLEDFCKVNSSGHFTESPIQLVVSDAIASPASLEGNPYTLTLHPETTNPKPQTPNLKPRTPIHTP